MLIKVKMVSGECFRLRNTEYSNIEDWLKGNFSDTSAAWWMTNKDSDFIIRISNIESIHAED